MAPRWLVGFMVLVSLSAGLGALSGSFPDAPMPPAMNAAPEPPANQAPRSAPRTPPPAMDQSGISATPA